MKKYNITSASLKLWIILVLFIICECNLVAQENDSASFKEYKGKVIDKDSEDNLSSVHLKIKNSAISTITNNEGEFSLKIPKEYKNSVISISLLGYESKNIHIDYFETSYTVISLSQNSEKLSEVQLFSVNDAKELVKKTLDNKGTNYLNEPIILMGFYRENIQQRNRNVSLSEAVVKIQKQPYNTGKEDEVSIFKARKSSDYNGLDTIAFKLRGGPYSPLFVDIVKYPDFLFYKSTLEGFEFTFAKPTKIDNKYVYVVNFKELNQTDPWYFGKLYIDAKTATLVKADYSLNVDDRRAAMKMFVQKKPGGSKVFPIETAYKIDYTETDGKWYYSYGNASMKFVVNWKNKLFNSRYTFSSELVVTNRMPNTENWKESSRLIKPTIVMIDDVSGFSDINFWGENNIIAPNETIKEAIEKIRDKI